MSDARGTLESLLREVAMILSPLTGSLTPDNAPAFFSQIGIPLTTTQANTLSTTLSSAANRIKSFLLLSNELSLAIDVNGPSVSMTSLECVTKLKDALDAFDDIASAIGGLGLPGITSNVIPNRLFNHLIVRKLSQNTGLNELLEFGGILERTDHNVHSNDPDHPFHTIDAFHFDRIGGWLESPAVQLQNLYGWGNASFDGIQLLEMLNKLLAQLGVPVFYDSLVVPPKLDALLIELEPKTTVNPKGMLLRCNADITIGVIELAERDWELTLNLGFTIPSGTEIVLQPNGQVTIQPPDSTTASGQVRWSAGINRDPAHPMLLLGQSGGSRVQLQEISLFAEGNFSWKGTRAEGTVSLGGDLKGGRVLLSLQEGDGFLQKILSGLPSLENSFDVGFGLSQQEGLYFHGSSALEIQLASHVNLGSVALTALTFSVGIKGSTFPIGISSNLKTSLGPLLAAVEDVGITFDVKFTPNRDGNVGLLDIRPKFKPPNGVGLALDGGGFKGGGFLHLDMAKGEYAGTLELEFQNLVTVKAIGILSTKMPNGDDGFSLLIIISAEFIPIQLGFGFTLVGVGGLIGLNRTVMLDVLRQGVRDGSLNSVLFPRDVVVNAPRIINDLKRIFPPLQERVLIGPMAKLGWGTPTLISLELGIILEIPSPVLTILGVLRMDVPAAELPIMHLQVNFLGIIDFDKAQLSLDAALFDSRLLNFTLTGDMAVRLYWGRNANFLLSAGGFHPAYSPPPMGLGPMRRLAVEMFIGNPRVRAEAYFALTSNTVQFGAKLEVEYGIDAFNVYGFLALDVLIHFDPFRFIAEIAGMIAVRSGSSTLFSISLELMLEGPTPWHARGRGSFRVGFIIKVTIAVRFDVTVGEERNTALPPIEVLPRLRDALTLDGNWRAVLPTESHLQVSVRELPQQNNVLVLHPFGTLEISQKVVPLNLDISRFGTTRPHNGKRFHISAVKLGAAVAGTENQRAQFAPAQFIDMSDAEKLSARSFEEYDAGVKVGGGDRPRTDLFRKLQVAYEVIYLPRRQRGLWHYLRSLVFEAFALSSAVSKSALSAAARAPSGLGTAKVSVEPEKFAVASTADLGLHGTQYVFASEAEARGAMATLIDRDPGLGAELQVVPFAQVQRQ